jgi:hypothetical protein
MQWSKLRFRVKELICPELKKRIDFFLTSYRKSHDGADKVWITIDGQRIFSCSHYPSERAWHQAYLSGLRGKELQDHLAAREIHGPADFGNSMRAYMDMPVTEALKSANPLIRAFALIDRRIGRRTLQQLEISDLEHTLVKAFYRIRTEAVRA